MKLKKSQTATEYMIIVAVVLVISLIVVSNLGIIPGIGGTSGTRSNDAQLRSGKIGITSYAIQDDKTVLTIQNNERETLTVNLITLNNIPCLGFSLINLGPGQSRTIECINFNLLSGTKINLDVFIKIEYTDNLGASFI